MRTPHYLDAYTAQAVNNARFEIFRSDAVCGSVQRLQFQRRELCSWGRSRRRASEITLICRALLLCSLRDTRAEQASMVVARGHWSHTRLLAHSSSSRGRVPTVFVDILLLARVRVNEEATLESFATAGRWLRQLHGRGATQDLAQHAGYATWFARASGERTLCCTQKLGAGGSHTSTRTLVHRERWVRTSEEDARGSHALV